MSGETLAFLIAAIGRIGTYLCILAAIGACAFRWRVVPRLAPEEAWVEAIERRVARFGFVASVAFLGAGFLRLFAQTYSIFGIDEPLSVDSFGIVLLETSWGNSWIVQMVCGLALAESFVWARHQPRFGWVFCLIAAGALGVSIPLTGHAMSEGIRWLSIAVQSVHILAVSVWLGTLFVMLRMGFGAAPSERRDSVARDMVERFSPLALTAVSMLVVSGSVTAVTYLDSWAQLWNTGYGKALLLKVAFFLMAAGYGAYNWRRLRLHVNNSVGRDRLVQSASMELAAATFVLIVTSVLVALPIEG